MRIFGLRFGERDSGGGVGIITRHPLSSPTWYWYLSWSPWRDWHPTGVKLDIYPRDRRYGQWHHYLYLGRLGKLILGFQNYHKKTSFDEEKS